MSFLGVDTNFTNSAVTTYSQKYLGVSSLSGYDPNTAVANMARAEIKKLTTTPEANRPAGSTIVQNEVKPIDGQPSTTPSAEISMADGTKLFKDDYRHGVEGSVPARQLDSETEAYANIDIEVTSTKKRIITAYARFFLQRVDEPDQEKVQVIETFTAFYAYFYGRRPRVYRFSGTLLNDDINKWTNDMSFFYDNYFRGTRAMELGGGQEARAVLTYDNKIVHGFLLDMNVSRIADSKGAPFSFQVLVIDDQPAFFSNDITSLIDQKKKDLKAIADKIQSQLAEVNKNIDSSKSVIASQVRTGKKPPISLKLPAIVEKIIPSSVISSAMPQIPQVGSLASFGLNL